jgi:hypothetical protein
MVIDTENLNGLSLPEVGLLLMLYNKKLDKSRVVMQVKDTDIKEILHSLYKKGFISASIYSTDSAFTPPYKHLCYSLLEKGKIALAENCVQEKKVLKRAVTKSIKDRCDALAIKLMEIYPMGKKPGTNTQWRGYKGGISERLQKLIIAGNEFTDEEAVAATKSYVTGFNGMYTTMRCLPYFLGKKELVGGEVKNSCDFMTFVEDIRNNPQQINVSKDWDLALR